MEGTTERDRTTVASTPRAQPDARGVLVRAVPGGPSEPSRFDIDQMAAHSAASVLDPDASLWLDTLNSEEAREVFELLQGVADEHRRRAEVAMQLTESIRQRFRSTAGWNEPASVGVRAG